MDALYLHELKKGSPFEIANPFKSSNHFERMPWRAASAHRVLRTPVMRTAAAVAHAEEGRFMNHMNDMSDMNDVKDMDEMSDMYICYIIYYIYILYRYIKYRNKYKYIYINI